MAQSPRITLIDCGSVKVPALAEQLEQGGARCDILGLDAVPRGGLDGSAGVVISGGPRLFTAEPALVDAFAFIDELIVPTLGICLGHQAIALRHGAAAFLGPERRAPEPITLLDAHPLLVGLASGTVFGEDHCEGVSLPAGFQLLGSSQHYEVEIMAGKARPFYGVQFHPEISGAPGAQLLANFVAIVLRGAG